MKLNDFDKKVYAFNALEENYKMKFDLSSMNKVDTQTLLKKVRTLANEARENPSFHKEQASPSYMKLVFMEEALVSHYNELLKQPTKIVVENEEVEKSQVVLAAQDLVDTVQKMLEDVGQMQVKELPAIVDAIESEIGVNEAQSYDEQVSSQLDILSDALKEAFSQLKNARNVITGQEGSFVEPPPEAEDDIEVGQVDAEELGPDADLAPETGAEIPPIEEPEEITGAAGRAKR